MATYSRWFLFKRLNYNTLYFSFKYLSFRQALRVPVFVHKRVLFKELSCVIEIPKNANSGDIWIGYGSVGIFNIYNSRTILEIKGTLVFEGTAYIGQGSRILVGENGRLSIGTRCIILKGAELPRGSILAANAVVTKKLETCNGLYGGQPAKLLKENVYWEP